MKAVHHIEASSTETMGAFNKDFDRVHLHRPTMSAARMTAKSSSLDVKYCASSSEAAAGSGRAAHPAPASSHPSPAAYPTTRAE